MVIAHLISQQLYRLFRYNDKPDNVNFESKLERVQYNMSFTIAGASTSIVVIAHLISQQLYRLFRYNDKPDNVNFESKLERVQYNMSFTIAGAIQGTNRDSIYAELGLESFSKIFNGLAITYIKFAREKNHCSRWLYRTNFFFSYRFSLWH